MGWKFCAVNLTEKTEWKRESEVVEAGKKERKEIHTYFYHMSLKSPRSKASINNI